MQAFKTVSIETVCSFCASLPQNREMFFLKNNAESCRYASFGLFAKRDINIPTITGWFNHLK